MINGHGDDAYRYTAIHANFSSNVYHRVNHDGLNRYLAGCLPCIRSYPEPEPYALAAELARLHGVSPEEVCVTNGATTGDKTKCERTKCECEASVTANQ